MLYFKIFFGKMVDVTLSTISTIYIVKNRRLIATIFGFIDVFIWLLVVNVALNAAKNSMSVALVYSIGYAFGTYLGSFFTCFFNKDSVCVQIVTKNENNKVSNALKNSSYSASLIECKGIHENDSSYMIYSYIKNKEVKNFKNLIIKNDKNAFISVIENKESLNGYFEK